jgi:transcriptional/translational regulatory protein YebC/TACO1
MVTYKQNFIKLLEDDDDVQYVYANIKVDNSLEKTKT